MAATPKKTPEISTGKAKPAASRRKSKTVADGTVVSEKTESVKLASPAAAPRKRTTNAAASPEQVAKNSVHIAGLGASAGGLEALRPLIAALRPNGKVCYIVAQHMAPQHTSILTNLLAKDATIPVETAKDGQELLPDHVYVCPPNRDVLIRGGRLALDNPSMVVGPKPSVDRLFRSIAEEFKEYGVGVVLSGTGSDGSHGCRAIKAEGGLVIVQKTESAKYDGMPSSAIRSGVVDIQMDIADIAQYLNTITFGNHPVIPLDREKGVAGEPTLRNLLELVFKTTQSDFSQYKEATISRQVVRRISALRMNSLAEYYAHANSHPSELAILQKSFLISVTSFFRDTAPFAALKAVMANLVHSRDAHGTIRVWVPGCATGEEAYSIAIMLAEELGSRVNELDVRIFGTDIDSAASDVARAGVYPEASLENMDPLLRRRYFTQEGRFYKIKKSIREMCVFALHNMVRDPPFLRMDIISCRNVLIYFNQSLQEELFNKFHYSLNAGGCLLLGKSESTTGSTNLFSSIDARNKLYRRRPVATPRTVKLNTGMQYSAPVRNVVPERPVGRNELMRDLLLREYAPASILVSKSLEPLHFYGSAQRYLHFPQGTADFSILSLCLPEIRTELRTLIARFNRDGLNEVLSHPTRVVFDGMEISLRIVMRQVWLDEGNGESGILISFEEQPAISSLTPNEAVSAGEEKSPTLVAELQKELQGTREHLQAVIEELETSNEELQSLNEELQASSEELQSSNEELQTTNEELQATNEELVTVNDELQAKSIELTTLNETLTNIQDSTQLAIIVVDARERIIRYNQLAVRVFGLMPSDIGLNLTGVPCHLSLPNLRKQIESVVRSGVTVLERSERNGVHYLMRITPYCTDLGKTEGAVLTFTDISDLRRLETELLRSEERFRLMTSSIQDYAITMLDAAGRVLSWNQGGERLYGYKETEIVGKPLDCFYPANDIRRGLPSKFLEEAEQKERSESEGWGVRKDGTQFISHSVIHPVYDDARQLIGFVIIARDVTQMHQAAEKLRLAATVFERAGEGMLVTDAKANILTVNEAFCRISGYSAKEVIGRNPAELKRSSRHPDEFYEAMWSQLNSTGHWEGEIWNKRRDGSIYPEWLSINSVKDAQGRTANYVGIFSDITQRKEHETALKEAKEAAETANKAKTAFLANMSHEIRTPMNAILGFAQLMRNGGSNTPQQQDDFLAKIEESSRSLMGVLNEILDYSKIEAGYMALEVIDFRLDEVLSRIADMFSMQVRQKNLDFVRDIAPDVPISLGGDPLRLSQILSNLVSNAIKFTEKGHVGIRIEVVRREEDNVVLHFAVDDTGIGLSKEQRREIFRPFVQADMSTTRKHGGTGLGLAISKRLANLMGGDISVASEPGKGSVFSFTVTLRVASADLSKSESSRLRTAAAMGRLISPFTLLEALRGSRILLVEDNESSRQVACELLGRAGMLVTTANTGKKAVELVRRESFDAVLMDLLMPEMDGLEAARRIRGLGRGRDLPIIAMTASAMLEDRKACLAAGMNDHIAKPFDVATLGITLLRCVPLSSAGNHAFSEEIQPDGSGAQTPSELVSLLPGVDVVGALRRIDGNVDLYRHLLDAFAEQHRNTRDVLSEQKTPDTEAIYRIAHNLKAEAGNLGLEEVHLAAEALAEVIRDRRSGKQAASIKHLQAALDNALQLLASLPAQKTALGDVLQEVDSERLLPMLRELAPLLDRGKFKAKHVVDQIVELLQGTALAEAFVPVSLATQSADLDGALISLKKFMAENGWSLS